MSLDRERWIVLAAGLLVNLCQGAAYASSVFAVPMLTHLGLLVADPAGKMAPDMKMWAAAFAWNLGFLPVGMLLSGKVSDKGNPRLAIILGGTLFGLGMFLAGFATTFQWFIITFGVMMGIGSGMAYGAVVAVAVRWFPDRRGLASGLAVGALGFGSFILAPVADMLMKRAPGSPDEAVLYAFKVLGIAFIIVMGIGSIMLSNPPRDYCPVGYEPNGTGTGTRNDLTWTEMLGRSRFWILYVLYACGAFTGLMIISQAKPIVLGAGYGKDFATAIVAMIGLANATGRIAWGFVSDKIGRIASLALMFLLTCGTMLLLPTLMKDQSTLIPATVLIGACFGGYLGTFPSLCADSFGAKNIAVNYAVLFSSFSVAAICGPYIGGFIKNNTGSYDKAFLVAAAVAGLGLLVSAFARAPKTEPAAG